MSDRLVSIDIEPGGIDRPVGFIGLVEVVDGALTEVEVYRFMRPDIGYTWNDWCAAQRVEAWKMWMRLDENGQREAGPPIHGAFSSDDLSELLGTGDRFMPEYTKPEPPALREVWAHIEPRVRDGYVAAYGARFDRAQLRALLRLAGLPQPSLLWLDGMEAIRHLTPRRWDHQDSDVDVELSISAFTEGGNSLDAQVVRHGLLDPVTAARRWSLHLGLFIGNKPTSFDAGEDARLNAVIFQRVIKEHGSIEGAVKALGLHAKPHPTTAGHAGRNR